MKRTRRGVLGTGVGLAAGLAGCLGAGGVEYPDAEPPATGGTDGTPGAVETAESTAEGDAYQEADADDTEALADATRDVVGDAVWFATEWPAAVRTHREAMTDVAEAVVDVRETAREDDAVRTEMADRLESVGRDAAARSGNALSPHFTPEGRVVARTMRHVEVLRNFAERGDVDRFIEELNRMESGFRAIGTSTYVGEQFSRSPIHNRLLRRLLYPLPDDADDRRELLETTVMEVRVASEEFGTFARLPYDDAWEREQTPRIYGDAFESERQTELRARMGPVPRPEDRVTELFVTFARRPQPNRNTSRVFEGWPSELSPVPVYVQEYPDAETAADRLDAVTAAGETEEREPIDPDASRVDGADAPTNWHRFYHHEAQGERYRFDEHAGVQYGYVVQAGEFLLATGFSGDAWEERVRWQGTLRHGWVVV